LNHFLPRCAKYIYENHKKPDLADICVILPTRRAVFFFKKALARQSDGPFIAPHILAVEDFILETTNMQLLEPIDLIFELFNAFKEVDNNAKFELFMTWAPTLLKDFEGIDQYLVDAKQLFSYMTEAKAIERWGTYNSKNPLNETSVNKYFELFKTLFEVYTKFNQSLKLIGKAYRGSAYRHLAENVDTLLIDNPKYSKYYFLGFNALSVSENKIIKTLFDAKLAETLWDSDDYYMKGVAKGQLAGKFLKKIKSDANFGSVWNWQDNNLAISTKNIKIIGVQNASQQPMIANHYLNEWFETDNENNNAAVILADENLLPTLLTHIPKSVGEYNVTMGVSMKTSPIFSLIEAIFELQRFTKKEPNTKPKFNSRLAIKILNHSFIRQWAAKNDFNTNEIIDKITASNNLFLAESEIVSYFENDIISQLLFINWNDSTIIALQQFNNISSFLQKLFTETNNQIDAEFLFHFYKILNRLEVIVESNLQNINIAGLKNMLFELVKQTKVPFEGQPISPLQIMGMLETRTLDFDKIIILSVNENFLPAGKKSTSLIPFDALKLHDMPTYGHQDAVMAYHFFRLLQHAKEVVLTYVLPKASYGGNEKSRFIMQIEKELARINPNITIEKPTIKYENTEKLVDTKDFEITKSSAIIAQIKAELGAKGLYATPINEYVSCSMQYYFKRIAKIDEQKQIDEIIGADKFGNWIHKTLENIDLEILRENDGVLDKATLKDIKTNLKTRLLNDFKSIYGNLSLDQGMNLISLNIALKILEGYFANEIEKGEFPQEILAIEKSLYTVVEIAVDDEIIKVKIGGKIDKIDKIGSLIRVIDYKTGKVEPNKLKFNIKNIEENVANFFANKNYDKLRQLWLYRYLLLKNIGNETVFGGKISDKNLTECDIETGIYSFRNNKAGFMEGFKSFNSMPDSNADFITKSEELITELVLDLLNEAIPFKMTDDLKTCEFCNYRGICNR
jgi:PD-(D/E)XK nuclease superfamily